MRAVASKIIVEQCEFEILRTGQPASVHVVQKYVVEFQEDTRHSLAKAKEFKNRSANFLRKYTTGKDGGKLTLLVHIAFDFLNNATESLPRSFRCNIWVPTILVEGFERV